MIPFFRRPLTALIHNHLIFYPTPANLTYFWGFGSLAGLLLASQILTGIFLAMHYTPHVDLAFASLEHIMRDVNHGWFIRYLHANGASFFFFIVYVHLGRTLYFGFYTPIRTLLWVSGVVIFVLMMAIAFMGYVLPWGQMSFWGATVITNLFSALPYIGEDIAYWLWGGFSVNNATLSRFFSLHYLLPFVLVGLVGVHLVLLHQQGSYNPLAILKNGDKISFYPYFYVKDYFGFLVFSLIAIIILAYAPDMLGHPDNYIEANALVTPAHIVPEWYFLPFYAILRAVPSKLGGVVLMGLSIAVLLVLPCFRTSIRSIHAQSRRVYQWFFWFFAATVIFLGVLGGLPIEFPYTQVSQVLAFYYFFFFFALIPFEYYLNRAVYLLPRGSQNARLQKVSDLQLMINFLRFFRRFPGFFVPKKTIHLLNTRAGYLTTWATYFLVNGMKKRLSCVARFDKYIDHTMLPYKQFNASYRHPYHLVDASPWPFLTAMSLTALTVGFVMFFHQFNGGLALVSLGLVTLLFIVTCWFRDIVREGTFEGHHTLLVQRGLKIGMILFIISEVCFFFSFFWGFFHSSLSPAIQIGGIWPPKGIEVFNPWEIPLLNTLILLTSGVSVTWAHFAVRAQTANFIWTDAPNVGAQLLKPFLGWLSHQFFYTEMFCVSETMKFKQLGYTEQTPAGFRQLTAGFVEDPIGDMVVVSDYYWTLMTLSYVMPISEALLKVRKFGHLVDRQGVLPINFRIKSNFYQFCKTSRHELLLALLVTIVLGLIFTLIQYYEYKHATFTIADSVYGSTFYLTTGFHGLHVIIGTLFLIVCFVRAYRYHFSQTHHVGLESAIWYWHFVDVVWLGLYISIYHWGGSF